MHGIRLYNICDLLDATRLTITASNVRTFFAFFKRKKSLRKKSKSTGPDRYAITRTFRTQGVRTRI